MFFASATLQILIANFANFANFVPAHSSAPAPDVAGGTPRVILIKKKNLSTRCVHPKQFTVTLPVWQTMSAQSQ